MSETNLPEQHDVTEVPASSTLQKKRNFYADVRKASDLSADQMATLLGISAEDLRAIESCTDAIEPSEEVLAAYSNAVNQLSDKKIDFLRLAKTYQATEGYTIETADDDHLLHATANDMSPIIICAFGILINGYYERKYATFPDELSPQKPEAE